MLTKERLIVALDVDGFERAKELMDILYPTVRIFKIGSELFTSCGLDIMKVFQRKGAKVFLGLRCCPGCNAPERIYVDRSCLRRGRYAKRSSKGC